MEQKKKKSFSERQIEENFKFVLQINFFMNEPFLFNSGLLRRDIRRTGTTAFFDLVMC